MRMSEDPVRYRTHCRAEYDEEDGSPSVVAAKLEAAGELCWLAPEAAWELLAVLKMALFIVFQAGPRKVVGVNGCQVEDLLEIALTRLRGFQARPFPCPENAAAIQHLVEALAALRERTAKRQAQGVEGQSEAHQS